MMMTRKRKNVDPKNSKKTMMMKILTRKRIENAPKKTTMMMKLTRKRKDVKRKLMVTRRKAEKVKTAEI